MFYWSSRYTTQNFEDPRTTVSRLSHFCLPFKRRWRNRCLSDSHVIPGSYRGRNSSFVAFVVKDLRRLTL